MALHGNKDVINKRDKTSPDDNSRRENQKITKTEDVSLKCKNLQIHLDQVKLLHHSCITKTT